MQTEIQKPNLNSLKSFEIYCRDQKCPHASHYANIDRYENTIFVLKRLVFKYKLKQMNYISNLLNYYKFFYCI